MGARCDPIGSLKKCSKIDLYEVEYPFLDKIPNIYITESRSINEETEKKSKKNNGQSMFSIQLEEIIKDCLKKMGKDKKKRMEFKIENSLVVFYEEDNEFKIEIINEGKKDLGDINGKYRQKFKFMERLK